MLDAIKNPMGYPNHEETQRQLQTLDRMRYELTSCEHENPEACNALVSEIEKRIEALNELNALHSLIRQTIHEVVNELAAKRNAENEYRNQANNFGGSTARRARFQLGPDAAVGVDYGSGGLGQNVNHAADSLSTEPQRSRGSRGPYRKSSKKGNRSNGSKGRNASQTTRVRKA